MIIDAANRSKSPFPPNKSDGRPSIRVLRIGTPDRNLNVVQT